nr:unnamed protein product [Callosobruchus analis]
MYLGNISERICFAECIRYIGGINSYSREIIFYVRRLKTYLRNSTSQDRLTGLALMSVYREINISNEEVLDMFSTGTRRLNFIL